MSKLTEESVRAIRKEYKEHQTTQRELAKRYSVSQPVIQAVVSGKAWKQVAD